jgi:prefoldin subunit 5
MESNPGVTFAATVVIIAGALATIHLLLSITKQIRDLWFDKGRLADRPVTRADLDASIHYIHERIEDLVKLKDTESSKVDARLSRAEQYAQSNVHELRGLIQSLSNTVSLVQLRLTDVVQASVSSMGTRLDKTEATLAKLGNTLSQLVGEMHALKSDVHKVINSTSPDTGE